MDGRFLNGGLISKECSGVRVFGISQLAYIIGRLRSLLCKSKNERKNKEKKKESNKERNKE